MSHQIAYAITDRLPAEILAGDRIHAPAPGPAQHEPARIILILGDIPYNVTDGGASISRHAMNVVIPNGISLVEVQAAAQFLADMAETAGLAAMAAQEEPKKTSRKKKTTEDATEE